MVSTITSIKRKDGTIRNNHYYQCGLYNNTKTCKPNLVNKEIVDAQAKQFLFDFSKDPKLQELILNKLNKSIDSTAENEIIVRVKKEIKTLEVKIDNGYTLLLEIDSKDQISKDRVKSMIISLEEKVNKYRNTITEAQDKIFIMKNESKIASDISKILSNLESYFSDAPYEKQKNVLDYLIKSITVHNDLDIKKRSIISGITLQFSSEEVSQFNFDTLNNVWFTCGRVHP